MNRKVLLNELKRYTTVFVWGIRSPSASGQRNIHNHIYTCLRKIGFPVNWGDNKVEDNNNIPNGSLVISAVECSDNLIYKKENWYVGFHKTPELKPCKNFLQIRAYGDSDIGPETVRWDDTVLFNKAAHILSQSFTTDLMPEEFQPPIFNETSRTNPL